jgi:peptidylprolyl isomerase
VGAVLLQVACAADSGKAVVTAPPRTMGEILAATTPADWRPLEPLDTLYVQLPQGRVVIELAPAFAPRHAANLRTLVRQGYFDGLAVIRSQDNFVVQWGDPENKRSLGAASATLPPEFVLQDPPPATGPVARPGWSTVTPWWVPAGATSPKAATAASST